MSNRQLFVDFELHADDDLGFKKELIGLMINNLQELKEALEISLRLADMSYYKKACHKVSSTIALLADNEFNEIVQEIKVNSSDPNVERFTTIHAELVKSLEQEQQNDTSYQPH
ncbi:MAG TPA: hypothetical protein VG737_16175 [Cyclobacteriaceae bacterium]|nr:hypothetical protein [Cyclobacteriaceae bacterium]